MLRGGSASAGFKQTATVEQRHDGQHLRARAHLKDREQVGEVVTQYVAGHRDGVFALTNSRERVLGGVGRGHDLDREPGGVVLCQIGLHLGDDLRVVRAALVEPEHGRRTRRASARDCKLHPVADGNVFGLGGAPNVALGDSVRDQHLAGGVDDLDAAGGRNLERLVVAAILFGGLSHQAHIWHGSDGGRVERAVCDDVFDGGLVDTGIRRVRDDRDRVVFVAVNTPELATIADQRRHRGINDDIGWHVQVADAAVTVDVAEAWAAGQGCGEFGADLLAAGHLGEADENRTEAVVRGQASSFKRGTVLGEHLSEEGLDHVAEQNRVADLHHGGLQVHRVEHVFGFGLGKCVSEEGIERFGRHESGVNDLALKHVQSGLQHGLGAIGRDVPNGQAVTCGQHHRLFVREKIVVAHGGNAGLGSGGKGLVHVWVLARVVLDRQGRTAVAVAFTQHRVDRAALDAVVASTGVTLSVGGSFVWVVGNIEAGRLQLGDRRLELRNRGGDVRQLDDVGFGGLGQFAELFECVADLLLCAQALGEYGEDAPGERDVAGFDRHICGLCIGLNDGEERGGCQCRCFVGVRVDNGRIVHDVQFSGSGRAEKSNFFSLSHRETAESCAGGRDRLPREHPRSSRIPQIVTPIWRAKPHRRHYRAMAGLVEVLRVGAQGEESGELFLQGDIAQNLGGLGKA